MYFPPNPTIGQEYVATNCVTYTYLNGRWNSAPAIQQGTAEYYVDNGDASFVFNANVNAELDGGNAQGQ